MPGTRSAVVRRDLVAGLTNAIVSVPDGLASAALAGVNPVYGLYTNIAAPIGSSLLKSAQLMQVVTTTASALAAGQAIASYPEDERDKALFLLVLMTGIVLAMFGLLRLGRLVRFVSHSAMTGFLIGVAAVLVLDQLAPLVGYSPEGGNEVIQLVDLLAHVASFDSATVMVVCSRWRWPSDSCARGQLPSRRPSPSLSQRCLSRWRDGRACSSCPTWVKSHKASRI